MAENVNKYLFATLGWILTAFLATYLLTISFGTIPAPYPLEYTEGIMAWGTKQISEGKWPYGDIEAIPSRYSTYGPLPYSVAALIASVFPDSNPLRFVQAGRLLSLLSATLTALLIGLACKNSPLTIATLTVLWLTAFSELWLWQFRVDMPLLALQAGLLFTLSRPQTKIHTPLLSTLAICMVLTKPTCALDVPAICITASFLRKQELLTFIQDQWKPLLKAGAWAAGTYLTVDLCSGFLMTQNILLSQSHSGLNNASSLDANPLTLIQHITVLPLTLLGLFSLGSLTHEKNKTIASLMPYGIGLAFFVGGTLHLKNGADINYFFPTWMLLLTLIGHTLLSIKNTNLFCCIILGLIPWALFTNPTIEPKLNALLPTGATSDMISRINNQKEIQERFEKLKTLHNQPNILSEEIFYSVAANQEPLVTDIFQTSLHYIKQQKNPEKLFEVANGAWGEDRLIHLASLTSWELFVPSQELGTKRRTLSTALWFDKKHLKKIPVPENLEKYKIPIDNQARKTLNKLTPNHIRNYLLLIVVPSLALGAFAYQLRISKP